MVAGAAGGAVDQVRDGDPVGRVVQQRADRGARADRHLLDDRCASPRRVEAVGAGDPHTPAAPPQLRMGRDPQAGQTVRSVCSRVAAATSSVWSGRVTVRSPAPIWTAAGSPKRAAVTPASRPNGVARPAERAA